MANKNTIAIIQGFPADLKATIKQVYDRCGFELTNPKVNIESGAYGACTFELNGKTIQHRVSKITPTKTGQFATIWKRNSQGLTVPFDMSDDIDFIVITARSGDNLGQFIFPKAILVAQKIISQNGVEGKRGMRVYPPWDTVTNKQAEATQRWQAPCFLTIKNNDATDLDLTKKLFAI